VKASQGKIQTSKAPPSGSRISAVVSQPKAQRTATKTIVITATLAAIANA
jgi:hypothetical protein